jgi:hypothetical protein
VSDEEEVPPGVDLGLLAAVAMAVVIVLVVAVLVFSVLQAQPNNN